MAKTEGFNFTSDEIAALKSELSDEALDLVLGGSVHMEFDYDTNAFLLKQVICISKKPSHRNSLFLLRP